MSGSVLRTPARVFIDVTSIAHSFVSAVTVPCKHDCLLVQALGVGKPGSECLDTRYSVH
ncbi:Uncharacterised protein [Mycobacteroides abscessus subsp. abscessus]|nr:Uncharacterised protein [Mycobacteroides abscessus subsp. abscessus]